MFAGQYIEPTKISVGVTHCKNGYAAEVYLEREKI